MITVKLYGLLRLDWGIRECQIAAGSVKEALDFLASQGIPRQDLNSCVILVNGKNAAKRSKLKNGDVVQLLSPVAGG